MFAHLPAAQREAFNDGFRAMLSPSIAIATWGLVTGVAMAKLLSVPHAIGMSLLVYAGSAQLAALPLIAANIPLWTIFLTAAIVNVRFLIFGAAIQPHFKHRPLSRRLALGYLNGDIGFVLFMQRYPPGAGSLRADPDEREAYFLGLATCNWLAWQIASIAGILLAAHIPNEWNVGFAGTLALMAIAIPLLADRAGAAALLAAAVVSLAGIHWPYRLNLVAAVVAATVVGVLVDRYCSPARQRSKEND
jgi:predicted branched-subunit amino acid permease